MASSLRSRWPAVAGIALFGRGERTGAETAQLAASSQAATQTPRDVSRLVEQFSAAPTAKVVERLEAESRRAAASPTTFALLGLGYQQLFRESGDPTWLKRAGNALLKGRDGAPSDPIAVTGLAQLAVTQHRFRDGATLARAALRLDPQSSAARGALGDALFNLGRYDAAFAEYDRLAGAGPSVAAYARVAFARQLEGRRLAAIDAMELALEAGSGIPGAGGMGAGAVRQHAPRGRPDRDCRPGVREALSTSRRGTSTPRRASHVSMLRVAGTGARPTGCNG